MSAILIIVAAIVLLLLGYIFMAHGLQSSGVLTPAEKRLLLKWRTVLTM